MKDFDDFKLEKVEWREYYDDGIMEGLKFHWSNNV